jgi:hypothetical protein
LIDFCRHTSHSYIQILVKSLPDNPDRTHAFKVLNTLSKQCKRFVTVKTVKLDGKEEQVASGGFGSISKATHNGKQVAVKAIVLYSQKDNSQAERVRPGTIISNDDLLNLSKFRCSDERFFYGI